MFKLYFVVFLTANIIALEDKIYLFVFLTNYIGFNNLFMYVFDKSCAPSM